ncbi:hypothetical protein [Candidatus Phytoplasma oryzae]|nr:hypothetical protein PIE28_01820 [Candidatus Phytoplasma oryzae]
MNLLFKNYWLIAQYLYSLNYKEGLLFFKLFLINFFGSWKSTFFHYNVGWFTYLTWIGKGIKFFYQTIITLFPFLLFFINMFKFFIQVFKDFTELLKTVYLPLFQIWRSLTTYFLEHSFEITTVTGLSGLISVALQVILKPVEGFSDVLKKISGHLQKTFIHFISVLFNLVFQFIFLVFNTGRVIIQLFIIVLEPSIKFLIFLFQRFIIIVKFLIQIIIKITLLSYLTEDYLPVKGFFLKEDEY